MPVVPASVFPARRWLAVLASLAVLAVAIDRAVALPLPGEATGVTAPLADETSGHLVVSELMTGGASASDEFIELYNPTAATLPLEGLELVYVTASGATVTRKAAWSAGAPGVPGGAHLLIANSAGVFAAIADVPYTNGLASTGGSVALRILGAATAIDALGWGNAANAWLEARPAPAPAAGSSLERLPGGSSGSSQDTDDNLLDFAILSVPDPQNSGSPPVPVPTGSPSPTLTPASSPTPEASATATGAPTAEPTVEPTLTVAPSATPMATLSPTPTPSPLPTVAATGSPSPAPTAVPAISIAAARALPDGSVVTVEGIALTAGDFTDGGGYVADASAGIAVLVSDGSFDRGQLLRITGTLDDRYAQRTIRASASTISALGVASERLPEDAATGSIGEGLEGSLVDVTGVITSSATTLSTGVAWDLDDGTGATRVLVGNATGIDTSSWARGTGLTLIGVVGQRDSSGSGTSGFRVQPRDAADILAVEPVATPGPTATPALTPSLAPTPTADPSGSPTVNASATPSGLPLVSIGEARAAATGMQLRIRGVVTAQSSLLESGSAVLQDSTAAILVRLGDDAGKLALGEFVELEGTRSTKAGMLTLRAAKPPLRLGRQADPDPVRKATGAFGEAEEARLVIARGVISTAVSRPKGGSVSFAIDDGSGPLRVTISSRAAIATGSVKRGAWLELRGVLGQQTTNKAPLAGYRLWPRLPADLRVIAAPVAGGAGTTPCCTTAGGGKRPPAVGGPRADALEGDATPGGRLVPPILARPHPTSSPASVTTATSPEAAAPNDGPRMAGLVVSGIGLAALAALVAWFSRRRPRGEPPSSESLRVEESNAPLASPHLSLLRSNVEEAQEERRILPPI